MCLLPKQSVTSLTMNTDTQDFLDSLLWDAQYSEKEEGTTQAEGNVQGCTIADFHPEFVQAAEEFVEGFKNHLRSAGYDLDQATNLERDFGRNIYGSLNGGGVGFFDDHDTLGDELQKEIRRFARHQCQMEELASNLWRFNDRLIHLSFTTAESRKKYLDRYFAHV